MLSVVASVLHLGNVQFATDEHGHAQVTTENQIKYLARVRMSTFYISCFHIQQGLCKNVMDSESHAFENLKQMLLFEGSCKECAQLFLQVQEVRDVLYAGKVEFQQTSLKMFPSPSSQHQC